MTNDAYPLAERRPDLDVHGIAEYRRAKRLASSAAAMRTGEITGITRQLSLIAAATPPLPHRPLRVATAPSPPSAGAPLRPQPITGVEPAPARLLRTPAFSPDAGEPQRVSPAAAMLSRVAEAGEWCATVGPISWGCAGTVGAGAFLAVAALVNGGAGLVVALPSGGGAGALTLAAVSVGGGTLRPLLLLLPGARPGVVHTPPARPLFDATALALAAWAAVGDIARSLTQRLGQVLATARRDERPIAPVRPLLPALALALAVVGVATAFRSQPVSADDAPPAARGRICHPHERRTAPGQPRRPLTRPPALSRLTWAPMSEANRAVTGAPATRLQMGSGGAAPSNKPTSEANRAVAGAPATRLQMGSGRRPQQQTNKRSEAGSRGSASDPTADGVWGRSPQQANQQAKRSGQSRERQRSGQSLAPSGVGRPNERSGDRRPRSRRLARPLVLGSGDPVPRRCGRAVAGGGPPPPPGPDARRHDDAGQRRPHRRRAPGLRRPAGGSARSFRWRPGDHLDDGHDQRGSPRLSGGIHAGRRGARASQPCGGRRASLR